MTPDYLTLPVAEVMRHWPATIGVFVDLNMFCIGCPIAGFHTPLEAAREHGLLPDLVLAELGRAIAGGKVRRGRTGRRRRSEATDAAASRADAASRPRQGRPSATR